MTSPDDRDDHGEDLAASLESVIHQVVDTRLGQINTCLPGEIVGFHAQNQTCDVQPTIARLFEPGTGFTPLPICKNVPVVFPGGGGFSLTFPIQPGDECLLIFSQRCIDNWWVNGGVQNPDDFRRHHLSDAIAIIGLRHARRAIPNMDDRTCTIRSDDGQTRVEVGPGTIGLRAQTIRIDGRIEVNGELIVDGLSLNRHVHAGVQPGPNYTTPPTNGLPL